MKRKFRRLALASALLAAIIFGTYGFFARAQARVALTPPRQPVRGSANGEGRAVAANGAAGIAGAAGVAGVAGAVPMVQAAYTSLADGNYAGSTEYAYYGYVKVNVVVSGGKITNVQVPTYPNDNGTSRYINSVALPYLVQETVQAQSGRINLISGATFTSIAFERSLGTALSKATAS